MVHKITSAFLIASLMAIQVAVAQHHGGHGALPPITPDPAPQHSDLTVDQVIAKSIAARGGEQKLKGIQSVQMKGAWQTPHSKASAIALTIAPGRYLRRIDMGPSGVMVKALDGQTTWELNPHMRIVKPTPMHEKDAARFRRLADPQGPLVGARTKGNRVEMVGKMTWKDSNVYKLRITFPDGGVNYVYLDGKSFLPVRVVNTMYLPQTGMDVVIEFRYEDYREVNGVKWPFVEKAYAPEAGLQQTITWKTIEVNKPLDAAAFKAPKT